MKNIVNDYCLGLFDIDYDGINLQADGYLYSTNAIIAARIKPELCVKEYPSQNQNCGYVYREHSPKQVTTLKPEKLLNDLMHFEVFEYSITRECEECGGTGESDDLISDTDECKACDGWGEIDEDMELRKCKIFDTYFNYIYIELIVRTAVFTGVSEIMVSTPKERDKGTLFTVGNFEIILMPLRSEQ